MAKLLIVVDMQNDFVGGALKNDAAEKVIPNIEKKIESYLLNGENIVFTRDTHKNDYMETEEGKNLPVPHCLENTDGWQIVDKLKPDEDNSLINVFNKDTFGCSDLFEYFRKTGSEHFSEIELVGVCTDICVISNAVISKTACPNAHLIVDAACCAGVTPESHDTALNAMKALHVEVKNQGSEPWR